MREFDFMSEEEFIPLMNKLRDPYMVAIEEILKEEEAKRKKAEEYALKKEHEKLCKEVDYLRERNKRLALEVEQYKTKLALCE